MAENKKNVNEEALEEDDFITLEFEDGVEVECEIMGIFDVDFENGTKEYIALLPDDGTNDVYLYGYKEISEEEFELIDIIDDAEFDKVAEVFNELDFED